MKLFVVCSKNFYDEIEKIKNILEDSGADIEIYFPNCYDERDTEVNMKALGKKAHQEFKARMFKQSEDTINKMDAILVLNFDKEKDGIVYKNYIGGATFLEMYNAFRTNKTIYLYNDIPEGILYDEIDGFAPTVINGNLDILVEDSLNK